MRAGAVGAGLVLPIGDGALVQAEGGDDGGQGAAVGEQGDDAQEEGLVLVQAVEGRALGRGEGLAAGGTAEAPVLVGVDLDVAVAADASVRAIRVVAEYALGVHGLIPTGAMAVAARQNLPWTPFRPPHPISRFPGVLPAGAARPENAPTRSRGAAGIRGRREPETACRWRR